MAKKNDNKVETADEVIAKLTAQLAAAQELKAKEIEARNEEIATNVRKLTDTFGVATLSDVINLIKQVEKGTLGKLDKTASEGRTYTRLTDEQKDTIRARRAKGGSGNQVSELATEFNVSIGTIYNLSKETAETPAAPAEVVPVAAS